VNKIENIWEMRRIRSVLSPNNWGSIEVLRKEGISLKVLDRIEERIF
jgi:hypothetical protein